jgi:type IV pilus assembly protein PilY1
VSRSLVQPGSAIADSNSFFGDFIAADWNSDYSDDVLYVGTVQGSEASPSGSVKRIVLNSAASNMGLSGTPTINTLISVNKPVVAKPTLQRNLFTGDQWVMFGTGRLYTAADNQSTTQQAFYGVLEPSVAYNSSVTESALVDVSNVLVTTSGNVFNGATTPPSTLTIGTASVTTFQQLQEAVRSRGGWKRNFTVGGGLPSERNISEGLMIGSSLVFTSYKPSGDACDATGNGFEYALNFGTGTASPFNALDSTSEVIIGGVTYQVALTTIGLGKGLPSSPRAINNTVFIGTSQGTILPDEIKLDPGKSGRQSWRYVEIPF